jgi:ComF family protein
VLERDSALHAAAVRALRRSDAVVAHDQRRRRPLPALPARPIAGGALPRGCRTLAPGLAARMRDAAADLLAAADAVVAVPLHRRRRRGRGFNQADDLARQLGCRVMAPLRRVRATAAQADLPAARRHANVRDAFALRRGHDVRGLRLVLIDDVCTTGATLDACARVLLMAGAVEVSALTAARVPSRPIE